MEDDLWKGYAFEIADSGIRRHRLGGLATLLLLEDNENIDVPKWPRYARLSFWITNSRHSGRDA